MAANTFFDADSGLEIDYETGLPVGYTAQPVSKSDTSGGLSSLLKTLGNQIADVFEPGLQQLAATQPWEFTNEPAPALYVEEPISTYKYDPSVLGEAQRFYVAPSDLSYSTYLSDKQEYDWMLEAAQEDGPDAVKRVLSSGLRVPDTYEGWVQKQYSTAASQAKMAFKNNAINDLTNQITNQWQLFGLQPTISGINRANELAQILTNYGITDLSKVGFKTTDAGTQLTYGDKTFGRLGGFGTSGGQEFATPQEYLTGGDQNRYGVAYSAAGKGWVDYDVMMGPGNTPVFVPRWSSSSDLDPELLQVVGIALAFTGVGATIGGAITSSLGVTASAATNALIGSTLINTLLNGGDIGAAIKGSLASYVGAEVGGFFGDAAKSMFQNPEGLKLIENVTSQATRAVLLGQNPEDAIKATLIAGAVDFGTSKIPGFSDLPAPVKSTITQSISAAVQGQDVDAGTMLANAAKEGLLSYGLSQIPQFKDADTKTQSFITTMLRTAINDGDLSQSAVNWAVGQANQEFQRVMKAGPALDELKKAGIISESSYYSLNDDQKRLVDSFASQSNPQAAAAKYINEQTTTDAEIKQFYKQITGRDATDADADLLKTFVGVDEATAKVGLENQIRANIAADELRFDELQKVFSDPKSTDQELINKMAEFNITPAFVEKITGRKYDEIVRELDARFLTQDEVKEAYRSAREAAGLEPRDPTPDEILRYTGKDANYLPQIQAEIDREATTFDGSTFGSVKSASEAAKAQGYNNFIGPDGKPYMVHSPVVAIQAGAFDGTTFGSVKSASDAAREAGKSTFVGPDEQMYMVLTPAQEGMIKDDIKKTQTFGQAFADARAKLGPGRTFEWTNPATGETKTYNTYAATELYDGSRAGSKLDAALLAQQNGKTMFQYDGKIWNIPPGSLDNLGNQTRAEARRLVEANATAISNEQAAALEKKLQTPKLGDLDTVSGKVANLFGITAQGLGQQVQMFADAYSAITGTPYSNSFYKIGQAIEGIGNSLTSRSLDAQTAAANNILKQGEKADFLDQPALLAKAIKENPGWFGAQTLQEGAQEIAPWAATLLGRGAALAAGVASGPALLIGLGVGAISDGLENLGSGAREAYDILKKAGVPEDEARAAALRNGVMQALITAPAEFIADKALFKSFFDSMSGGVKAWAMRGLSATAQQALSEGIETVGQGLSTKINTLDRDMTVDDLKQINMQSLFAMSLAGSTTSSMIAGGKVSDAAVVAKDKLGNSVTLQELLNGSRDVDLNTLDPSAVIAQGTNGQPITLGSLSAIALQEGFTPATMNEVLPTSFTTDNNIVLSRDALGNDITLGDVFSGDVAQDQAKTAIQDYVDLGLTTKTAGVSGTTAGTTTGTTTGTTGTTTQQAGTTTGTTGVSSTGTGTATGTTSDTSTGAVTGAVTGATSGTTSGGVTDASTGTTTTGTTTGGTTTGGQTQSVVVSVDAATNTAVVLNPDGTNSVVSTGGQPVIPGATVSVDTAAATIVQPAGTGTTTGGTTGSVTDTTGGVTTGGTAVDTSTGGTTGGTTGTTGGATGAVTDTTGGITRGITGGTTGTTTDVALAGVESRLSAAIDAAKASGLAGDAALDAAIQSVSAELGTTKEALLGQIGKTETQLRSDFATQLGAVTTELGNVESRLTTAIDAAKAQGLQGDAALQSAIDAVAADLGTSREALLGQIGKTETQLRSDFSTQLGAVTAELGNVESRLNTAIEAAKASGLAGDAALNAAIQSVATDLGASKESLLAQIGKTESQLRTDFASQLGAVSAELGNVESRLTSAIDAAKASGLQGDAALQSAINTVAADLGTTKEALLGQLGKTETQLRTELSRQFGAISTELGNVETRFNSAIEAAKASGLQGDAALQAAINSVAADLGTSREALLGQIGKTETQLRSDFSTQLGAVTTELGNVETRLRDAISAAEASGLSRDQAIQSALNSVAADLGLTKTDLLSQIGKTEESLRAEFQTGLTGVEGRLAQAIQAAKDAGLQGDAALQSAIDTVSAQLGTTKEDLLGQIGKTETQLRSYFATQLGAVTTEIGNVETRLQDAIAAAEARGMTRDQAIQSALDAVASDLGTTRADLLTQIGTTKSILRGEIEASQQALGEQIGSTQQRLTQAIADAEARGLTRDQAIQAGLDQVASDLGTTRQDLLTQLGQTQSALSAEIKASQETLGQQIVNTQQRVTDAIAAAEARGLTRDQAIQAGLDQVATDLGTTRQDLLSQLGTTADTLRGELAAAQTALGQQITTGLGGLSTDLAAAEARINERATQYEAAGLSRDQALSRAVGEVASQLGTTAQNLQQQISTAQTQLGEQIAGTKTDLQKQIDEAAELLGKPAQRVTQADLDYIDSVIKGTVTTAPDLSYDVNRDGKIDQTDFDYLQRVSTGAPGGGGEPPEFQPGTRWAPTGLFGEISGLRTDITTQLQQQELKRQQDAAKAKADEEIARRRQTGLEMLKTPTAAAKQEALPQVSPLQTSGPSKFISPLAGFLAAVETGSYLQPKPQQPTMTPQPQQAQTDRYAYGKEQSIDSLLDPYGEQKQDQQQSPFGFKAGGLAMGGGTRYGRFAAGGLNMVHHSGKARVDFRKGDAVTGPGDGQSDDIPAMLADGEYVLDSEIVAALGNGSTKAGSELLDEFRRHIRSHKRGGSLDEIPPPSKSPLEYLAMAKKSVDKRASKK